MAEQKVYPNFSVDNNPKPNRLLAFPILGLVIKLILLIPVFIEAIFVGLFAIYCILFINWFVILFTGKYWTFAYTLFLNLMRFCGKITLYIYGITDTYPGFALNTKGLFALTIDKPENPNRWFAIPFLGIFARLILLIPYIIFSDVLQRGSGVAMFLSWFVVLFKGRLPESLYEFEKDSIRVSFSATAYMLGLSDKYPSFAMSMNHQTAKILLIIAGALLLWGHGDNNGTQTTQQNSPTHRYQYRQDYTPRAQNPMNYKTY